MEKPHLAQPGLPGNIPAYRAAEAQQIRKTLDVWQVLSTATPATPTGEGFWVNEPRRLGSQDPAEVPATLPAARHTVAVEVGVFPFHHFDLSLPRSTAQLLTIRDFGRCARLDTSGQLIPHPVTRFDAPALGCFRHAAMWSELDWKGLPRSCNCRRGKCLSAEGQRIT